MSRIALRLPVLDNVETRSPEGDERVVRPFRRTVGQLLNELSLIDPDAAHVTHRLFDCIKEGRGA